MHRTLLLAALLLLAGCSARRAGDFTVDDVAVETPEGVSAYVPTLEGPLRILSATPAGPMAGVLMEDAPDLAVTVTFSKPVVPLGEAPDPPEGLLRLRPAVPGTLRWEGTQTLVFDPSSSLPPATAFTAVLAGGVDALDGDRLAGGYSWTFETPRPALLASQPAPGEPYFDPGAPLLLDFNQAIRAGDAAGFVSLQRTGPREQAVPVHVAARGDSALAVTPREPLAKGTDYALRLLPGLPAAGGPLGLADTVSVAFRTYAPLALEEVTQVIPEWQENPPGLDPARGVTLVFSTPVRFGDLRRALSLSPAVSFPPGIEAADEVVSARHTLPPVLDAETAYSLTIRGLRDVFGQTLAAAAERFRTHGLPPSITMPTGMLVVEAGERTAVPVRATNVGAVRLGMERLTAETIVPRVRLYDWDHYYGPEDLSGAEPVAFRRDHPLRLPANEPTLRYLQVDSLLTGGTGVVAVRMAAPEVPGQGPREWRAVAQVSRLGLTGKFSAHQNLVLVTDLRTAQPIPGATVTIRDAANRVRWRGTTDAQGRAAAPGWARLGIEPPNSWEHPVQFAVVEKDGDVAFTSSAYRDGIDPWRFDIPYQWQPDARGEAGSVFTDRGLYRTGETVHVKGILRRKTDGDWRSVTDSVRVLVDSPRSRRVLDRRLRPSELGTFDLEWTAPSTADQGLYGIRVVLASDTAATRRPMWEPGDVAQGSFRVDAFRTATFSVVARSAAPAYVAGDFFEGTLTGRYLFGAAMGGQPASYTLRREPASFRPPGYDGYRFDVSVFGGEAALHTVLAQADTVLDAEGSLHLRRQLAGNPLGAATRVRWEGQVTDPARQVIAGRTDFVLHPGLFYVGLKPETTFLEMDGDADAMAVDVMTVDPNGSPVGSKVVEVELLRLQWNSVREVGTDGRLRWRSERIEEPAGRATVRTEAGRARRLRMPVEQGGSYVVRATARDVRGNTIRSEAYFYAAGGGYVAWERTDDDHIELVPERGKYRPGETARILVQSPYEEATALVTVEREGILSSRVETLVGSTPQVEIPLTEAHLPNVYVSVILLHGRAARPAATADAGAPGFKVGYAALQVDAGVRHLQVEVAPERETYRPGEEVTVRLQLRDRDGNGVPGEIAFSAADAGVLNLIGYRLPDPFETFYGPRPLGVATSESRARLVEQRSFGEKEENLGGGGGHGSELLRRDFRPLAHWAPAVRTDARGRAQVRFRLPESLTTFRLMATALTAGHAFGAGSADVVVTQPLVLQPALPRFTRLGDRFEAGVLVTNTTGEAGRVTVSARAQGLTLDGPATQTLRLGDGETREVRFGWRAATAGTARLRFEAGLGEERDAFEAALPVAVPTAKEVTATFAAATAADETAREALRLPEERVPGLGTFEVQLASTALVGLDGAARYLFDYPYGCVEQKTSAIRPLLAADDVLEAFDVEVLGGGREAAVNAWLAELDDFWTGDGFAMWPGGASGSPYTTAYVVLALAEARDAGFDVDAELTGAAVAYLAEAVRNPSRRPEYYDASVWADARALMLYALARHGRVLPAEISTLASRHLTGAATLGVDGESFLLRTIALTDEPSLDRFAAPLGEAVQRRIRVESTTAYLAAPPADAYDWIWASDVRSTAFGLTALVEAAPEAIPQEVAARMVRYLMAARRGDHWASTQDNAAVVDALAAYFRRFETTAPDVAAEVRVAGQALLSEAFSGRSLRVAEASLAPAALPDGETVPVEIARTGRGPLYYTLRLETYSTAPQPALSQGLSVERRIERLDERGQPAGTPIPTGGGSVRLAPGELVRVTLRVTTPTDRHYVVVDDALPAGLEALNAAFETTGREGGEAAREERWEWWSSFDHTEIRDDRVLLFADHLARGEHTYSYVARATTPGTFVHPPAVAEEMYEPETRGRTATGTLVVE